MVSMLTFLCKNQENSTIKTKILSRKIKINKYVNYLLSIEDFIKVNLLRISNLFDLNNYIFTFKIKFIFFKEN
jgi:hypothetical protein